MFKNILTICIGNVCRSPVSEGLLKHYSEKYDLGLNVSSAGIQALVRQHAQPFSIQVAKEHGIDIMQHKARQLDEQMAREADLILVTDEVVLKGAKQMFPFAGGKFKKLGHFRDIDVDDPYQQGQDSFNTMYDVIDECTKDWLEKVWKVSF